MYLYMYYYHYYYYYLFFPLLYHLSPLLYIFLLLFRVRDGNFFSSGSVEQFVFRLYSRSLVQRFCHFGACLHAGWLPQGLFSGTRATPIGQNGNSPTSDQNLETGVPGPWRCHRWQSRCHGQGYEMSWITHGALSMTVPKFFT